jgi:hypothetical protein
MMRNNLRHTNFQVEPIKHIVGENSATAYQICVTPGNTMGKLGTVSDGNASKASNESNFESAPQTVTKSGSLLERAKSFLGL